MVCAPISCFTGICAEISMTLHIWLSSVTPLMQQVKNDGSFWSCYIYNGPSYSRNQWFAPSPYYSATDVITLLAYQFWDVISIGDVVKQRNFHRTSITLVIHHTCMLSIMYQIVKKLFYFVKVEQYSAFVISILDRLSVPICLCHFLNWFPCFVFCQRYTLLDCIPIIW